LFITHVSISTFNAGNWAIVINIPLEKILIQFYPRYFNPVPQDKESLNFYEVYRDQIEGAIEKDWIKTGRIQLDGVPANFHIEARINDYYVGKRHEGNKAIIWLFKKMSGLTTCSYEEFI
jgi:hypothetical protein